MKLISITNDLEYIKKTELKLWDNEKYKYYFASIWYDFTYDYRKNLGWDEDALIIRNKNKNIGFITWNINKGSNNTDGVKLLLEPEYLNSGLGVKACKLFLDYIFNKRNFRRAVFVCVKDNKCAKRIYDKIIDYGGRLAGNYKEAFRLRDGKYYDKLVYEILKKDYDKCQQKKD